jgi:phosphate/sulfate permease
MTLTYPFPTEEWQMAYAFQNDFAYIFFVLAVIFGFVLAFAVGANDSANSWGTPIGAGTISLQMAFLLGSMFEALGALFLSSGVINTIAGSDSVVKMDMYRDNITVEWEKFTR